MLKVIKLLSQIISLGVTFAYWSNGDVLAEILVTVFTYAIVSIPLSSIYFFKVSEIPGPKILLLIFLICFGIDSSLNLFNDTVLVMLIVNSLLLFFAKKTKLTIPSAVFQSNLLVFALLLVFSLFDNIFQYEIPQVAKLLVIFVLSLTVLIDCIRVGFILVAKRLQYFLTGYLFSGDMLSRNLALLFLTESIDPASLGGARLFFQLAMICVLKAQMDTFAINVEAAHGVEVDYRETVRDVMWSNSVLCAIVFLLTSLVCLYTYSFEISLLISAVLLVVLSNISAGPVNLFLRKNNRDTGIISVNVPIFGLFCLFLLMPWSVDVLFPLLVLAVLWRFLWLIREFKKI